MINARAKKKTPCTRLTSRVAITKKKDGEEVLSQTHYEDAPTIISENSRPPIPIFFIMTARRSGEKNPRPIIVSRKYRGKIG